MAENIGQTDSTLGRYVNQNCQRDMTVTRNVTRNAVVGALVSTWGVLRHRGKRKGNDLFIAGVTAAIIDDVSDLPGFGDAMVSVGWAIETRKGLVLPRFFDEYNADPEDSLREKNAERQRRFRLTNRNVTRNVTRSAKSNDRTETETEKSIYVHTGEILFLGIRNGAYLAKRLLDLSGSNAEIFPQAAALVANGKLDEADVTEAARQCADKQKPPAWFRSRLESFIGSKQSLKSLLSHVRLTAPEGNGKHD